MSIQERSAILYIYNKYFRPPSPPTNTTSAVLVKAAILKINADFNILKIHKRLSGTTAFRFYCFCCCVASILHYFRLNRLSEAQLSREIRKKESKTFLVFFFPPIMPNKSVARQSLSGSARDHGIWLLAPSHSREQSPPSSFHRV